MARLAAVVAVLAVTIAATSASAQSVSFEEAAMRAAVDAARDTVQRVLGANRHPVVPSGAAHTYDDKYALAETQVANAVAATSQALAVAGVTPAQLATMAGWAAAGRAVTLRFTHAAACTLAR